MFTLRALHDIEPNSPLRISYGCIPNYARLFNYGYTLDGDLGEEYTLSAEYSSHQVLITLSMLDIIRRGHQHASKTTAAVSTTTDDSELLAMKEDLWDGISKLDYAYLIESITFMHIAESLLNCFHS
jgi:hypothetical protein